MVIRVVCSSCLLAVQGEHSNSLGLLLFQLILSCLFMFQMNDECPDNIGAHRAGTTGISCLMFFASMRKDEAIKAG